jgi:hypothetical protein
MNTQTDNYYSIPARLRRMENLHILFWLMKDISWCLIFKPLGVAMLIPTLAIALWITWRNKEIKSELMHNLAIVFWITANGYWMISEFFGFDETIVWNGVTGKNITLIPFGLGLFTLIYYYVLIRPKEIREHKNVTM